MKTTTNTAALVLAVLAALVAATLAAVPDAARKPPQSAPTDGTAPTTLGSKKLATTSHCSGAVAFSGAGLRAAAKADRPLSFRTTLLDKGIGWKPEDGEFVCYCPGTYQFAFAGEPAATLVLKKKATNGSTWTAVVAGPHHVVLMDMELGESVGVFLEAGNQSADSSRTPTLSFSGFRVAKKQ